MHLMPLRKRIAFGYTLTVCAFVAVVILTLYSNQQTVTAFHNFSNFSDQALRDSRFTKTVVALQLASNRYIHEGHDSAATEVFRLYDQLQQMLTEQKTSARDNPIQKKIRIISTHLDQYIEAFRQAKEQRQRQANLINVQLVQMAARIETMLTRSPAAESADSADSLSQTRINPLLNQLLAIEISSQRYFKTFDAKHADRALMLFRNMQSDPLAKRPELLDLLKSYEQRFLEAVQRTRGYLYLLNVVMAAETYEMLYQSNQIATSLKRGMQQAESNMLSSIDHHMQLVLATTVTLLLLMLALGYMVGASITRPLKQVESIFKKMMQGSHQEVAIDYPQQDEISELIGAAKMYRLKNIEMQSLLNQYTLLNESLESRVIERTKALTESHQQAEEATRVKSQFLMMMSHEIRTPINAMIGMNYLTLQTDLNDQQRDYITKAHAGAQSLLNIVNDILDFSKIEAGKLTMETIDFRLDEVLNHLANVVALEAKEKGLSLDFNVHHDIPTQLTGDPMRLSQVLLNLVSNAIKFTESGEVSLNIEPYSEIKKDHEMSLKFTISDTGIGLDETQIDRLFQPFSQADLTTTRKYGGTGLGLAICKQVVSLMEGKIWVESKIGQGSRFIFTATFDLQNSCNQPPALLDQINTSDQTTAFGQPSVPVGISVHAESIQGIQGAKVLLVEDNSINQQIAKEVLEQAGLMVTIANNGQEAVQMLSETAFDIVLMDLQMPVMDGYEATRRIRQLSEQIPRLADLPIIAMSAHVMRKEKERCLAAGMNGFTPKPLDPDHLFTLLLHWIKPGLREREKTISHRNETVACLPELAGIDLPALRKLMRGDDQLIRALLLEFAHQFSDSGKQIRNLLDQGDVEQAEQMAHCIKGSAGNLSMMSLYQAASQLEFALQQGASQQGENQNLSHLLKTFDATLNEIIASIVDLREYVSS